MARAREMREASPRGAALGRSEEEMAFYDALETNHSAVKVLGDETLRTIARELVATVRNTIRLNGACGKRCAPICAGWSRAS